MLRDGTTEVGGERGPSWRHEMRLRKRTEITFESRRVLFVSRRHRRIASARCHECAGDVPMISVEYAAAITGLGLRQLFREIEGGLIHSREKSDAELLLCLNSLCARMPQTGPLFKSLMSQTGE